MQWNPSIIGKQATFEEDCVPLQVQNFKDSLEKIYISSS